MKTFVVVAVMLLNHPVVASAASYHARAKVTKPKPVKPKKVKKPRKVKMAEVSHVWL